MALVEVRNKALLAAQNSTVTVTMEGAPPPSTSAALPGTGVQPAAGQAEVQESIGLNTSAVKKEPRRSQGTQQSVGSSQRGFAETALGLKLNASSALHIEGGGTPPALPLGGGTQLITEEVAITVGAKPDVKGIDEPSGDPAIDQQHESNEDLQIPPIEPSLKPDTQGLQENNDQSPSVKKAVLQGANSRNVNPNGSLQPTAQSKTTLGEGTAYISKGRSRNGQSKSPKAKPAKVSPRKRGPPDQGSSRLRHQTEKPDGRLGTNRLNQIYILNQATSPQFKLANKALRRESAGASSNGFETATVGSRDSPAKRADAQKQKVAALGSNVQFQVQGSQKPVASMVTWFQGQQKQLRSKKQATARQRLMNGQSTLKPTSNYPTSQTADYLSASGTLTKEQVGRPRITVDRVPVGEVPFDEAQFETVQTSMRRDESRYSPTVPTQQVTPPRNASEFVPLAQVQQTQSNEFLLRSVGTQRQSPIISPQSKQSSQNVGHQTGQSFRSQVKSPASGQLLPTVFPAPEKAQSSFPKKNSLAKWEPSAQQSNTNLDDRGPPRQPLRMQGVLEEDSATQNLTTQQQQDSISNLGTHLHLRSFAPRLFDSGSLNLNELSEAIRSPKAGAGEPEKVFVIHQEEQQRLLTLKNMPAGLKKQLRNHRRQAGIQQQLSRRSQMARIDVVFPGEPKLPSQYQVLTETGQLQPSPTNQQISYMRNGPIYLLDGQAQQATGSLTSTLDGHVLVNVQNPIETASRTNISMTHHLPQARPIPNGQKYRIDHTIPMNNSLGALARHQPGPNPIEHWNQAPGLQAMSSLVQLMPGQIKEVELSSEGEEREDNASPGETQNSKHIIQIIDSNKNLAEGLGSHGLEQLKHLASLQSLGVNNQASTNNITENLSPPGSQSKRHPHDRQHAPHANFVRAETHRGRTQSELGQAKLNVVNLDLQLGLDGRGGAKMGPREEASIHQAELGEKRKGPIPKRKEKDAMNDTNTKLNRDVSLYAKQRPDQAQHDEESLRKGVVVDRDSINSSPSIEAKGISKSKFPRNQSLVSSIKLDYTLKGKHIEQGLQFQQQSQGQTSVQMREQPIGGNGQELNSASPDDRANGSLVQVITSQVGRPLNPNFMTHGVRDTLPTQENEQSVTAYYAQEPKKSISVSPIKDPAQKHALFDAEKQHMSQTQPEKWNDAIVSDGIEPTLRIGLTPSMLKSSPEKDEREQRSSSVTGQDPASRLTVLTEQEEVLIHAPMQLATEIISGEVAGFADSVTPAALQEKSPRARRPLPQLGMTQTVLNKDLLAPESPKGQHRGMPKPKTMKRRHPNRGASNGKKTVFNNQMIRDMQK